jgi:hypothetical protein
LAINGGTTSNHALIFNGDTDDLYSEPILEQYRALAQAAYGFTNRGNSLQFYNNNDNPQEFEGTKIDGSASLAHLQTALMNIQMSVNANPGRELVNLFFDGHGFLRAAAAPQQNGMSGPRTGVVVAGGPGGATTTFDLTTDSTFWQELEVGIVPNDLGFVRFFLPQFSLAVSGDSMSNPIGITIDGLLLGSFDLASSPNGAELDINMPDSFTKQLLTLAAGNSFIPVSFTLQNGDWFQFATLDDVYSNPDYFEPQYGFGISMVVGPPAPEPAAWILIGVGFAALGALGKLGLRARTVPGEA